MVEALHAARRMNCPRPVRMPSVPVRAEKSGLEGEGAVPETLTYLANVMNRKAADFYHAHGAVRVEPAFEQKEPAGAALMFCRHCLRYSLGWCVRHGGKPSPFREPYYLVMGDGRRFRLSFDCKHCQMILYADEER